MNRDFGARKELEPKMEGKSRKTRRRERSPGKGSVLWEKSPGGILREKVKQSPGGELKAVSGGSLRENEGEAYKYPLRASLNVH